jgi:hypothetical protein
VVLPADTVGNRHRKSVRLEDTVPPVATGKPTDRSLS